jgi:hypothetical protein
MSGPKRYGLKISSCTRTASPCKSRESGSSRLIGSRLRPRKNDPGIAPSTAPPKSAKVKSPRPKHLSLRAWFQPGSDGRPEPRCCWPDFDCTQSRPIALTADTRQVRPRAKAHHRRCRTSLRSPSAGCRPPHGHGTAGRDRDQSAHERLPLPQPLSLCDHRVRANRSPPCARSPATTWLLAIGPKKLPKVRCEGGDVPERDVILPKTRERLETH